MVLDVARRPRYPLAPQELPAWLADLPGWNEVAEQLVDMTKPIEGADLSGRFELKQHVIIEPDDTSSTHPLVALAGMAYGAARLDDGIAIMVRRARATGASWTQIGEVLGVTKQAAWERYSGED